MIISFSDEGTKDVFDGKRSKKASKSCPATIHRVTVRKLDMLNQAEFLDDLRSPPGNRLEVRRADRKGQHSIRINNQYRICFVWMKNGPSHVEIIDYH